MITKEIVVNIEANLQKYINGHGKARGIKPGERYASFDYCFNYFQQFREEQSVSSLASFEHMHESCLQLGFYLASWGMFRGAAFLLNKSVKVYEPVIKAIASADLGLWEIDTHCYTPGNIRRILEFKKTLFKAFVPAGKASNILITKIILGTFGNVPAFDQFFKKGLGVSTFGQQALEKVANFYQVNKDIIEKYRRPTIDFNTGQPTARMYTRAKVIDMIFFIEGGESPVA